MVPPTLEVLSGPDGGEIELPLHLFWSGLTDSPERFDLDEPRDAISAYQHILGHAKNSRDLMRYLNGRLLERLWPSLKLPAALRQAWEDAHPVLCALPAVA